MSKKLYDILFEDAAPAKRPDLKARLATLQTAQKSKASTEKTASPTGKLGATGGGISQQQLVQGSQEELKKNVEAISAVADKLEPSEQEVKKAKEALVNVPAQVQTISHLLYPEMPKEQPKASKTEPQNIATARTLPQMPARDATIAKTQEVPQTSIEDIMRQQANMRAYPEAQRQAEAERARMQGAKTEVLPAAKPGLFNRLKPGAQAVRQRVGLEEAIKEAVKDGLKSR